jgi:hypothetical protein
MSKFWHFLKKKPGKLQKYNGESLGLLPSTRFNGEKNMKTKNIQGRLGKNVKTSAIFNDFGKLFPEQVRWNLER